MRFLYGVNIKEGCHHIRIERNRIEDICAGGVRICGGAIGCDPSEITSDCSVIGNHISHVGRRYAAGCGVLIMHAHDNEICDNEIHDLYYSGISAGWVWGYADSATWGNRICRNHIYNIGGENLSDMGGVYLLGKQRGTIVSENRIHDVTCAQYGAWGIYLAERPTAFLHKRGETISLDEWQSLYGHDRGSIVADPKLEGIAEEDFTLSPDSPVYALGFSPLPDAVVKGK